MLQRFDLGTYFASRTQYDLRHLQEWAKYFVQESVQLYHNRHTKYPEAECCGEKKIQRVQRISNFFPTDFRVLQTLALGAQPRLRPLRGT